MTVGCLFFIPLRHNLHGKLWQINLALKIGISSVFQEQIETNAINDASNCYCNIDWKETN